VGGYTDYLDARDIEYVDSVINDNLDEFFGYRA
jgi:hypothetical protein